MSGIKGITTASLVNQLSRLPANLGLKRDGKIALIKCPDHKDGKEVHPSMRINLEGNTKHRIGASKCFVCGKYYGSWSRLYNRLTGKEASESTIKHFDGTGSSDYIKALLQPVETAISNEFPNPKNSFPWNGMEEWRGIKGKLLNDIKAVYFVNPIIDKGQIFLPCYMHNVLAGGIRANIQPYGKRNYFNTSGDWVHTALFPFDYVKSMIEEKGLRFIVLVEGPRDALYLLQYGIPALAILGTGHAGLDSKYMLLDDLEIDTIVLAFDGDDAGRKAKKNAKALLKQGFRIISVPFDEGIDPAKLTKDQVVDLRKSLKANVAKHTAIKQLLPQVL